MTDSASSAPASTPRTGGAEGILARSHPVPHTVSESPSRLARYRSRLSDQVPGTALPGGWPRGGGGGPPRWA